MASKISEFFRQEKRGTAKRGKAAPVAPAPQPAAEQQPYTGLEAVDATPEERTLRQFDLSSKYGPCTGMTRLERWERASKLGLEPPQEVKVLLEAAGAGSAANRDIWAGRV